MEKGCLALGEYHPAADSAMNFVRQFLMNERYFLIKASISCTALAGGRLSEICLETIERIERGDPVSDRYLLGLAWFLKEIMECEKNE